MMKHFQGALREVSGRPYLYCLDPYTAQSELFQPLLWKIETNKYPLYDFKR